MYPLWGTIAFECGERLPSWPGKKGSRGEMNITGANATRTVASAMTVRKTSLKVGSRYAILFRQTVPFQDVGGLSQVVLNKVARMPETDKPSSTASIESQPTTVSAAEVEKGPLDDVRPNSEVEPLDQTKSDLIANLAHDLRTPFISIRGYTKMMLEERVGPINNTQREYLTIVAENTNRVIQLLNDLLQLATKQPLRLEPFDVCGLWGEVLGLVRPPALRKSIRITERIPAEPLVILGDRQKLMEVFAELLSNAVKITDQGGEIIVEVSNSNPEDITVKISGTGQSETSKPGSHDSLGTELSVVHDVIQLHGGRISVSSKTGEDIAFLITLPAL